LGWLSKRLRFGNLFAQDGNTFLKVKTVQRFRGPTYFMRDSPPANSFVCYKLGRTASEVARDLSGGGMAIALVHPSIVV